MKKYLYIILLAYSAGAVKAQTNMPVGILKIGDKMPDVVLTNLLNTPAKTIRLSDYKGKLVLIDFWDTHCGNCIAAIPGLDSLQKKLPQKIKIIMVDPFESDRERDVKLMIAREKQWSGINLKLPVVFQDTTVSKFFTFQAVPVCAWISPNGRLIALTDDDAVTAANIERVLKGESIILEPKQRRVSNSKPKT